MVNYGYEHTMKQNFEKSNQTIIDKINGKNLNDDETKISSNEKSDLLGKRISETIENTE